MKQLVSMTRTAALICSAGALISACNIDLSDSGDEVSSTNHKVEEPFAFAFAADANIQMVVEGINGEVTVTGNAGQDSIRVTGIRRVGSESEEDARAHLELLHVDTLTASGLVQVKTRQPRNSNGRQYTVNYRVTLPPDVAVVANNVNGTISVATIHDDVTASNVNGNMDITDIEGNLDASLVNGNIRAHVTMPLNGTIDMGAVNGNLSLEIPATTSALLSARLTNGAIRTSGLDLQDVVSNRQSLDARLGDGEGTIKMTTVNGNIDVTGF